MNQKNDSIGMGLSIGYGIFENLSNKPILSQNNCTMSEL